MSITDWVLCMCISMRLIKINILEQVQASYKQVLRTLFLYIASCRHSVYVGHSVYVDSVYVDIVCRQCM